jgi:hypothetical protein
MDIRQILAEVIAIRPEPILTSEEASQIEGQIQAKIEEVNGIYQEIITHKMEIIKRRWELEAVERSEKVKGIEEQLAAWGLKVGDAFYKERNEGIYIVKSIEEYHVRFERFRECRAWCWQRISVAHSDLLNGHTKLKKIKSEGPFKVGGYVMYSEEEYQVLGYMGYRVVLAKGYGEERSYRMVPHKKVSIYRSIIL